MYGALPKNEKTFHISLEGDTSGEKFEGQFTTKCVLNVSDKHLKELEKTRLMADYANPSSSLAGLAEILSTIRIKLVKWPDWWSSLDYGSKMLDENVIVTIYDEIQKLEQEWRNEIRSKANPQDKDAPKGNG
jgi:hypothetical protein